MTDYSPPSGDSVVLQLRDIANPPAGNDVVLAFGELLYTDTRVIGDGFSSDAYGTPVIINSAEILSPAGTPAGGTGSPTVVNARSFLYVSGIDSPSIGGGEISLRTRYISLDGLLGQSFGAARVEFLRRFIAQSGSDMAAIGTPGIGNRNVSIAPNGIYSGYTGSPVVGYARWITPDGFIATQFGTRVIPEIQQVYPQGIINPWGTATVTNARAVITPPGFLTTGTEPAQRWGRPTVYNLTQYITQEFDIHSGLVPPDRPIWTAIENRNRSIGAIGSGMSRLGYPSIDNNARPLLPAGIDPPSNPEHYKSGMVAYKIREVPIAGIEAPYLSGWGVVYNDARLLAAAGFQSAAFGNGTIANTRRTFGNIGGIEPAAHGTPMVDFRIRGISQDSRYSIAPPTIPLPEVKLYTRYIDGVGYDASSYGVPELTIHWNIIIPRWTLRNYIGSPSVSNNTPEIQTNGKACDEFGETFVRLQWRPVSAQGSNTQLFGGAEIAFRDRAIAVSGINTGRIGDRTTVSWIGVQPPSTQLVDLNAYEAHPGFGIGEPYAQVPPPAVNQQVLYLTGIDSAKYGSASITANTIRVEPGYQELSVGEPFVSLKIRTIMVQPFPDSSVFDPGKPRISPHTIWAVMEAPDQAQQNNPASGALHYVDGLDQYPPGSVFGLPEISLKNRVVSVFWRNEDIQTHFGQAQLFNKRSYIRPDGIRSQRFGWHSIPTTPQVAEQFDSADGALFGSHEIGFPEYTGSLTIYPNGFDAKQISPQLVENFIRYVGAEGFDSSALGTLKNQDGPYMWQGLRVGPLMPTIPSGSDMSQFGVQWISHRVRNLEMTGFDAFVCSYQLEKFDKRMRVTKAPIERVSTTITPTGFTGFYSGVPDIKLAARYIRPDGNSDQFRKGANHA